jgi:hypothetical protein
VIVVAKMILFLWGGGGGILAGYGSMRLGCYHLWKKGTDYEYDFSGMVPDEGGTGPRKPPIEVGNENVQIFLGKNPKC